MTSPARLWALLDMLAAEVAHHAACAVHDFGGWPAGADNCPHCSYRAALRVYWTLRSRNDDGISEANSSLTAEERASLTGDDPEVWIRGRWQNGRTTRDWLIATFHTFSVSMADLGYSDVQVPADDVQPQVHAPAQADGPHRSEG